MFYPKHFFKCSTKLLSIFLFVLSFSSCSETSSSRELIPSIENITFDKNTYPVVILGGGIAGLTAAVYFSQADIPCLVIEGPKPGGALSQSHSVRNWPGVIKASGSDIVKSIYKQAEEGGAIIVKERVVNVNFKQWPRVIETEDLTDSSQKREIKALAVIIAMGCEPNFLDVPGERGEDGYWGRGVGNCAVCEGSLYKNKQVAVVGGGDAAIAQTDYLSSIVEHVTIIVRRDIFRASDKKIKERVLAKPNVSVLFNTNVQEIKGNGDRVTHIIIRNNETDGKKQLSIDGLFLAIGSRPNTLLLKGQVNLDESGFVILKKYQQTSVPGVYAAGDISGYKFAQAITAAGDASKAALQATRFLKTIGFESSRIVTETIKDQEKQEVDRNHLVAEIKTSKDFEKLVIKSKLPVVMDLFSKLCIPCQKMTPVIEKLAKKFDGKIRFVKLNVSNIDFEVDDILSKLDGAPIQTVPSFIFILDGKEINRLLGEVDYAMFENKIENELIKKVEWKLK